MHTGVDSGCGAHCQHIRSGGGSSAAHIFYMHTTLPHRNTQWQGIESQVDKPWEEVHFTGEHTNLAHSTPQLGPGNGMDNSWKNSSPKEAYVSGGSRVTSIPAAAITRTPATAYITTQPCVRSDTNTREKGT